MGKTLLPDDFRVTFEMRTWAKAKAPDVDVDSQTEEFCDYWRAHGKKMMDWTATWRNWMRRAPQFARVATNTRWRPITAKPPAPPGSETARAAEDAYRRRMEQADADIARKYRRVQ